jgi:ribosomal-protein-serine acetyltransferase
MTTRTVYRPAHIAEERQEPSPPFLPPPEFQTPSGLDPAILSALVMQTELRDDAVALRPFRADDVTQLYCATHETIDLLRAWMTWCHPAYALPDAQSFLAQAAADWERDSAYTFAIVDSTDGTLFGSIGLNHLNRAHNFANVGYWVRRNRWRRGIASRAVRLVAQFGLRELRLNRLEIVIPDGNVASQRVAQKAGAKFEGILRNKLVLNGKSHDAIIYSLLENDLV